MTRHDLAAILVLALLCWVVIASAVAAGIILGTAATASAAAPRPAQQVVPVVNATGRTTERVSPLPSLDLAGRTEAPEGTKTAPPSPSPTIGTRPAPTRKPVTAIPHGRTLAGTAVWYRYRAGHAAAGPILRDAIGPDWRGSVVTVKGNGRSVRVVLSDWCACQSGRRLIDLDRSAFAALADPSVGVLPVTVSWEKP